MPEDDLTHALSRAGSASAELALALARRIAWYRGKFRRRRRAERPRWFVPVAALHALVIAAVMGYPFVCDRAWDGCYLAALAGIVLHWVLLSGECVLSIIEKKAFYTGYALGEAPAHQWFHDTLPTWQMAVAVSLAILATVSAGVARVLLRNLTLELGRAGGGLCWELMFGPGRGARVMLSAAMWSSYPL